VQITSYIFSWLNEWEWNNKFICEPKVGHCAIIQPLIIVLIFVGYFSGWSLLNVGLFLFFVFGLVLCVCVCVIEFQSSKLRESTKKHRNKSTFLGMQILLLCWFKTRNIKNEYISFYRQRDIFSCIIISYTCDLHLGPQILSLMNTKNQPNDEKSNPFSCNPFETNYVSFKIFVLCMI
jgi:hypothetical protein